MEFIVLAVLLLVLLFIVYVILGKTKRINKERDKIMEMKFPDEWFGILEKNVPIYKYLPENLKIDLKRKVLVFLDEKNFEGCQGIEINDEIKVTIAAQACVLLLNRKTKFYSKLNTILVYPHAYVVKSKINNLDVSKPSIRLGESWQNGILVLAWDHSKQNIRGLHDGQNVVFHEFAHQLDQESGVANGLPILEKRSNYANWKKVLSEEYKYLVKLTEKGKKDVIDAYGATNPAEFFAVSTETFFEEPKQMKSDHPNLYKELLSYYKLNPESWY